MNAILDTNILYYWTNVQQSIYDPNRIEKELRNFNSFGTPFWSIVELLTSEELDNEQKKSIFLFISSKRVPIYGMTPTLARLIPANITKRFEDQKILDLIIKDCLEYKKGIEIDLLLFLIESAIAVLGIFYDKKIGFQSVENQQRFTIQLESLILGNRTFLKDEITRLIEDFYLTKEESVFKNEFQSLALSLFYVVSLNYNTSIFGKITTELIDEFNLSTEESLEITTSLESDKYFKAIYKKMISDNQKEILKLKENREIINSSLNEFIKEMQNFYAPSMIKYLSILMRKLFAENTKITKNDMIDSQLFIYDPNFIILSAEKRVRNIYEEINLINAKICNSFINKISVKGNCI